MSVNEKEKPLVSVIMPAYNAEKYIREAIESILGQTYDNFELIIIDDCSLDKTMDVVNTIKDDRIRIFHNEKNMGIAYSRNYALESSKGKYIAIMDDDDVSFPSRFEEQVGLLEAREDIDIVGGRVQRIDEKGNIIESNDTVFNNPLFIKVNFLFRNIFHNSEVMFRKSIIDSYGIRYHDNCYGMEDFYFWIECSKVARITNLNSLILKRRYYNKSETARVVQEENEKRMEFYAYLQRLSIEKSGFILSKDELKTLNETFREGKTVSSSKKNISDINRIFKKMVEQAYIKEMDFKVELDIFLKKLLLHVLYKTADFWELLGELLT